MAAPLTSSHFRDVSVPLCTPAFIMNINMQIGQAHDHAERQCCSGGDPVLGTLRRYENVQ